jgi:hypothetical protein
MMATCDMGFDHQEPAAPEPEAEPVVLVDPGPNENDVEIARIEAEASVAREELWTQQEGLRLESQVDELRGEIRGMREVLDRIAPPEPEPQPVVVPIPPAEPPESADPVAGPPPVESGPPKGKKKSGWFSNYR